MAKRGRKLQEFVAHSANITCIKIGKKTRQLFITGGEDQKVNIWSFGSPTSLTSLCGHTSPVVSVSFDSREILVLAGASMGAVKLWDLEEAKMVRTLIGHRSNCTAVEFHPFGEFFASGSMDSNLKIWDIRKKGCIHTYKGHTRGINTIRFTPDGRWVVSGGLDSVVKLWDLTAGKLLHDFKSHEGHIRSIDFHPLEFLLATGSLDGTIKFWDLETFELIGSAGPEATGVRSISFHPDGRTLFCGLDDSLKVYSWEPVICHDGFVMGWATLGDLSICNEKILGCSYFRNSVRVSVADISLIEPYRADFTLEQNRESDRKYDPRENPLEKLGGHRRSTSSMSCMSPDHETKEIKNIYVDTAGGNPATLKKSVGLLNSRKPVVSSDFEEEEIGHLSMQKLTHAVELHAKAIGQANSKTSVVHGNSILFLENPCSKETSNSKQESVAATRASISMNQKPFHIRRHSATNFELDMEGQLMTIKSRAFSNVTSDLEPATDQNLHSRVVPDEPSNSCKEQHSNIKSVTRKFETILSTKSFFDQEKCDKSPKCSGLNSVKFVNGVAVIEGRTRTLVERFERRERLNNEEFQRLDTAPNLICETAKTSLMLNRSLEITQGELASANDLNITDDLMQNHDLLLSMLCSRLTKLQVMRHFWEQNDIKGVINAMEKLPDHSVHADVIGVVMEKMEIFTLDLFSCLLPVLLSLLNSKRERHVNVSLEMLLKLVAMFGPVVHSTISAPPVVGVDLQADKRLECCNQCSIHLEKIHKFLPALVRRGGLLAKSAQELNLVLQGS